MSALQQSTSRVIARYGVSATLRKVGGHTYNATTGVASITTADYTVIVAFFDSTRNDRGDMRDGESLVHKSDREVLMSTAGLLQVPMVDDLLISGGATWRITDVQRVVDQGVPIVYDLKVTGNV